MDKKSFATYTKFLLDCKITICNVQIEDESVVWNEFAAHDAELAGKLVRLGQSLASVKAHIRGRMEGK